MSPWLPAENTFFRAKVIPVGVPLMVAPRPIGRGVTRPSMNQSSSIPATLGSDSLSRAITGRRWRYSSSRYSQVSGTSMT